MQVPDGFAIMGVAAGQQNSRDLKTLIGFYRQVVVTSAGVRMSGSYSQARGGTNRYGAIDSVAVNQTPNDNEVFIGLPRRSSRPSARSRVRMLAEHGEDFSPPGARGSVAAGPRGVPRVPSSTAWAEAGCR